MFSAATPVDDMKVAVKCSDGYVNVVHERYFFFRADKSPTLLQRSRSPFNAFNAHATLKESSRCESETNDLPQPGRAGRSGPFLRRWASGRRLGSVSHASPTISNRSSSREELVEELVALDRPTYHLDIDLRTACDSRPEVDILLVLRL